MKQTFSILLWALKSRTVNGEAPVLARITINGKRTEISTNRKVPINDWNPEAQIVLGKSAAAKEINNYFATFKAKIISCHSKLESRGSFITPEAIKKELLGVKPKYHSVLEVVEEYLKLLQQRVNTNEPTLDEKTYMRFTTLKSKRRNA